MEKDIDAFRKTIGLLVDTTREGEIDARVVMTGVCTIAAILNAILQLMVRDCAEKPVDPQ